MKRHVAGLILGLVTLSIGFSSAPIRFIREGVGSGALPGGNNFCSFSDYSSTHFEMLSSWSCTFDDRYQARDYFDLLAPNNSVISMTDSHVLMQFGVDEDEYFCSSRIDGRVILNICSTSLDHLKVYEERFIREGEG